MTPSEMNERTMAFALRVMRLAESLPKTVAGRNIASQIVRSACSVAANYRAAQRSKSRADFSNKVAIVLEEADETLFWIELTDRAKLLPSSRLIELTREAEELVKIFASMRRTARQAA